MQKAECDQCGGMYFKVSKWKGVQIHVESAGWNVTEICQDECPLSTKNAMKKAIWDSDLIEIKKSTVSNIYIIASSKKNYLCLCSFHMKVIWDSDLIEIYKHSTKTNWVWYNYGQDLKMRGAEGPEGCTKYNWLSQRHYLKISNRLRGWRPQVLNLEENLFSSGPFALR